MAVLYINKKQFEKLKAKASDRGEEFTEDNEEFVFELDSKIEDMEVSEDGSLGYNLILEDNNEYFGSVSEDIQLDSKSIINLIEVYRKRLGKLKTVLEALKE